MNPYPEGIMRKLLLGTFALVMCMACAETVTYKWVEKIGPGQYQLKCEPTPRICYRNAAKVCPNGYNMVDRQQPARDFYRMYVRCK